MPHARALRLSRRQKNEVGRRGAKDDVARIQKRVGHQIQQLVAAGREHHLVDRQIALRLGIAIGMAQTVEHQLPQAGVAQRRAVLQRRSGFGRLGQDLLHRLAGDFDRQRLLIDKTGRQRDERGIGQRQRHQPADRLTARALGAAAKLGGGKHARVDRAKGIWKTAGVSGCKKIF